MIRRITIPLVILAALLALAGCDRSGAADNGDKDTDIGGAARGQSPTPANAPAPIAPAATNTGPAPLPAAHTGAPKVTGPGWEADSISYDFGEGWAAPTSLVKHTFTYRNVGTETLEILEAKPTCGCTAADNFTRVVRPGETGRIALTLTLRNQKNFISKKINVKTNDPRHPVIALEMRGNVKLLCSTTPEEGASFRQVNHDQRLYREVIIRSNVEYPLMLNLRPIPADSFFAIGFQEISAGREWKLTVSAEPPIPEGSQSTHLIFDTNSPDVRIYELYANCYIRPRIQIAPPKIVVNRVQPKQTKRNILIINNGSTPVEITSIMTSDPQLNPTLKPADPRIPNRHTIEVTLPPGYQPSPEGELIEIVTTDWEKSLIRIWVQRTLKDPPTRPMHKSQNMVPGRM